VLRLAVAGLRTVQLSILLAGLLLAWCPRALALNPTLDVSQYAHTAWKMRDGFVKGPIEAIVQTPDGYLWLGTDFGLMRFDGVRAVPWQPPPNQSLPSTYIAGLLASRDGTLWIGTLKGLASWKDGKLTLYPDVGERPIYRMVEDREGTIWAGELGFPHSGTLCAIGHGGVRCYGGDGTFGPGVFGLFEDHKGNLWVGVKDGVWRWNPGSPKFFSLPGNVNGIQCLGEDADGALLVGWKGGLYELIEGGTKPYSLQGSVPKFWGLSLVRDRDGSIWIPTPRKGVVHINQRRVDTFSLNDGLSSEFAATIFEDREGNIWAGTTAGLDRFHDLAVATFSVKQGLSSSTVVSVLADADGGVWVGTFEGLNRVKNGQVMIGETGGGKRDGKINGQNPYSIFQDHHGRVWVTTKREVGYLEHGRFVSALSFPDDQTVAIAGDKMGNLWVSHQEQGLSLIPPQGEVKRMPWADLGHKDDDAVTLAVDPSRGGLWLGFVRSGIAYLENGRIQASYGVAEGLGQGTVSRFRFDPDGTVWIGTDGGLSRLKNGRIATLTSKNGLPCDLVRWVIQDDDHSFWLSMPCGLVRILRQDVDAWAGAIDKNGDTAKAVQFTVFDVSDGVQLFPDTTGYNPRVARTPDGKLWFPAVDGVSVIDPNHLPFNKQPPPVHIEQITADRKTYDAESARINEEPASEGGRYKEGGVRLPAQTRDLRIDYTALSLVTPERVLFRYKLEGWDRDWQDAGSRRQAFYTNLAPKSYTFRVKACNNSGVWNEAGTFLDFSVAPAYYQTVWFRLSCVAVLLAMLWGLYQLRVQQLAREFNAGLEARVNERTRIARELHDSLLQGFQGLMFRLQAVREFLPGRPSEAMKALDIALERGDKVIVEGRDTISDLRQSTIGDSDIAQALTALGEEVAAQSENGSGPCVRVLVEGKQRELNPVLRDEIYRIAREALRNAFRHSEAQKIEAEITYGDSEFLLRVRDDGIGMAAVVANQGGRAGHWGLPGIRERAKSFGGKLEVWSEQGAGTEIELVVPAAVSYGESNARRKSWFLRKKN